MKTKLQKVNWRETDPLPHGSQQWLSGDGMFKLQCIDRYDDIPMRRKYVLYQWRNGWQRILETPSRNRVEQVAATRAAELDES